MKTYILNTNHTITGAEYSDLAARQYAAEIGAEIIYTERQAEELERQGDRVLRMCF